MGCLGEIARTEAVVWIGVFLADRLDMGRVGVDVAE